MLKTTSLYIQIALLTLIIPEASAGSMTLKSAEKIALERSSEVKIILAQSQELSEIAIAKGQFNDPKLNIAIANLPTDSFNFSQEPMTQIQLGIEQAFPKGASLSYNTLNMHHKALAKQEDGSVMRLKIRQKVRLSWLNLAFWLNAKSILDKEKRVFENLVQVTQSMLANNKTQQKDVIRANLDLLSIKNKLITVSENIQLARSELARWIGNNKASRVNPSYLPNWRLGSVSNLFSNLKNHPVLISDMEKINAKNNKVNFQKEQFKPEFSMGGGYGFRQGNNGNGSKRADFVQIKLGVSLPLFPSKRQNKQLKASQLSLFSQKEMRVGHVRDLSDMLNKNLATFNLKQRSANLYQSQLVPEAKHYAKATLSSYENNKTDFPTLAKAYVTQFNTELGFIQALRDRTQARINLLFIQGR